MLLFPIYTAQISKEHSFFERLVLINYFLTICFKERLCCIKKKVSWQATWKENIALHASQST